MKNLLLLLAGAAMFALTACGDDKDSNSTDPQPQMSKAEMLTAQNWVVASEMQTVEGKTVDLHGELPATVQDDVFKFSKDGEAVREEGVTREDGNPDIVDRANWLLRDNEQNLAVAFDKLPIDANIVEISDKKMVLRDFDGKSETITTFEAQ